MKRELMLSGLLVATLLAVGCGEAAAPSEDENALNATVSGKGDQAEVLAPIALRSLGSLNLGAGAPVEIAPLDDLDLVADADCSDGCLHLVRRNGEELELLDSLTPSLGTGARHLASIPSKGAAVLATESGATIVRIQDDRLVEAQTIALASEPEDIFAGAAILLVARGGAGLDVVKLRMDEAEPATMLFEGITDEHRWVSGGEEKLGFFRPVEIELGRDNQLVTRSNDGTLFRTNIPAPDLIVHDAAQPDTIVADLLVDVELGATFAASGPLGITEINQFSLKQMKTSSLAGAELQGLLPIPGALATYIGVATDSFGFVEVETETVGAEIKRSLTWRELAPLGASDVEFYAADRTFLVASPDGLSHLSLD